MFVFAREVENYKRWLYFCGLVFVCVISVVYDIKIFLLLGLVVVFVVESWIVYVYVCVGMCFSYVNDWKLIGMCDDDGNDDDFFNKGGLKCCVLLMEIVINTVVMVMVVVMKDVWVKGEEVLMEFIFFEVDCVMSEWSGVKEYFVYVVKNLKRRRRGRRTLSLSERSKTLSGVICEICVILVDLMIVKFEFYWEKIFGVVG